MPAVNVSLFYPFLQIFHNRGHKSLGAFRVTTVWRLTHHLGNRYIERLLDRTDSWRVVTAKAGSRTGNESSHLHPWRPLGLVVGSADSAFSCSDHILPPFCRWIFYSVFLFITVRDTAAVTGCPGGCWLSNKTVVLDDGIKELPCIFISCLIQFTPTNCILAGCHKKLISFVKYFVITFELWVRAVRLYITIAMPIFDE